MEFKRFFDITEFKRSFDITEFKSESFQRVFHYLRRHEGKLQLDSFSYIHGSVESNPKECLNILLRFVMPPVKIVNMCNVQYVVCVKSSAVRSLLFLPAPCNHN